MNSAAAYIATLMLESLERFPKVEQERRLEAIRQIGLKIGRKKPRKSSTEIPTKSERRAVRGGEAAYRKGDYVTPAEYFAL